MSADRIPHTRFIESFDPVRFPDNRVDQNNVHAKLDLFIQSILFGEQMIVPEPYSFDSAGFLRIATEFLGARPPATPRRKQSPAWNPFLLVLRPDRHNYRRMIGMQLRNPRFILSGWAPYSDDMEKRDRLARQVEAGKWAEAGRILEKTVFQEQLEQVRELDAYFSRLEIPLAGNPAITLKEYIKLLEKLRLRRKDDEMVKRLGRLQESIHILEEKKVDLENRSVVRIEGKNHLSKEDLDGIVEYIDSSYSEVVHSSTRGTSVILSTPLIHRTERQVVSGQEISSMVHMNAVRRDGLATEPDGGRVAVQVEEDIRYSDVLSPAAIWEIVTDPDWIRSAQRLRTAAALPEAERGDRLVRARYAHVEQLVGMLTRWTLRSAGGWFTVTPDGSSPGWSYSMEERASSPGRGRDRGSLLELLTRLPADIAAAEIAAGYSRSLTRVADAAAHG